MRPSQRVVPKTKALWCMTLWARLHMTLVTGATQCSDVALAGTNCDASASLL